MPQRVYWNFLDDDSTFDLNFRELGIFDAGRYRGFDPVLSTGLTLTLTQSVTGVDKTESDGSTVTRYGIWNSRQGSIVTEDNDINLPIAAGDATNPRIDLIVGQHQYVFTAGGAAAVYLVIEGTPAANPTAPALTLPAQQVILGQIYVPAGTTDLNSTGVVYTPAPTPNYGGDDTIAHTDRENNFEQLQTVRGVENYGGLAFLDTASSSLSISLRDSGGLDEDNSLNVYKLSTTSTPAQDYQVTGFSNLPTPLADNYHVFTIFSDAVNLRFAAGTVFARNYTLKAGGAITFSVDDNGVVNVLEGDEAALGRVNRFNRMQILNAVPSSLNLSTGLVNLDGAANVYNLNNTATNDLLRGITRTQAFDQGDSLSSEGGGFIWLIPNGNFTLRIAHFDVTVPLSHRPIWVPLPQQFLRVKSFAPLLFVEDNFVWRLCTPINGWYDITPNFTVTGGGAITVNTPSELKVKIDGGTLFVRGFISFTTTGIVTQVTLDLGLPYNWSGLSQVTTGSFSLSGGTLPKDLLFIETLTGSVLRFSDSSGNFPVIANRSFQFSASFELGI